MESFQKRKSKGSCRGDPFKTEKKGNLKEIIVRAVREANRMLRKEQVRAPAPGRCLGRASLRGFKPQRLRGGGGESLPGMRNHLSKGSKRGLNQRHWLVAREPWVGGSTKG